MNSVQCIMHCVRTFILLKNCHIWLGSCMEKKALTISNWVYFYSLSDNIVRIMYCTYFLFLVSYSLPPASSQPFSATVFYYCWYKSRSFSQKKSESYSVLLKWGSMLLCKSLLITEYSGHVPPKSWSFLGMLMGHKGSELHLPLYHVLPGHFWAGHLTPHLLFSVNGNSRIFPLVFPAFGNKECFNAKPASSVERSFRVLPLQLTHKISGIAMGYFQHNNLSSLIFIQSAYSLVIFQEFPKPPQPCGRIR